MNCLTVATLLSPRPSAHHSQGAQVGHGHDDDDARLAWLGRRHKRRNRAHRSWPLFSEHTPFTQSPKLTGSFTDFTFSPARPFNSWVNGAVWPTRSVFTNQSASSTILVAFHLKRVDQLFCVFGVLTDSSLWSCRILGQVQRNNWIRTAMNIHRMTIIIVPR